MLQGALPIEKSRQTQMNTVEKPVELAVILVMKQFKNSLLSFNPKALSLLTKVCHLRRPV